MRTIAILLALVAASPEGVPAASSPTPSRCDAAPVGSVTAFVEDAGDSAATHFIGVVTALRPASAPGLDRVTVRDAAGRERRLAFSAPGESLPVRVGTRYGFQIEHQGEAPRCSAVLVWDRQGLLYAAAADTRPGAVVLRGGVPELALALEPHRCSSRPHDPCFEGIYNTRLRVTLGRRAVALVHGEEASLGGWRVRCLTAQEAIASPRCADAAPVGVAYTLRRTR